MTTIKLETNSAGLQAIPEVISVMVPGLDLSVMETMLAKFQVAEAGSLALTLDTKRTQTSSRRCTWLNS